jgi:hypothetical protein
MISALIKQKPTNGDFEPIVKALECENPALQISRINSSLVTASLPFDSTIISRPPVLRHLLASGIARYQSVVIKDKQ